MPRGNTHIETELASGLRLLEEFSTEGDARADKALAEISAILRTPLPKNPPKELPRMVLSWETQVREDGRGGRRGTADYVKRARDVGLTLPQGIGWEASRDAVRAWETACVQVENTHYGNLLMGDPWRPES